MVKVIVADVLKQGDKNVVLLRDEAGDRTLPIWIGQYEGASIALALRNIPTPRPMTYSFITAILDALGAQLEEARVETLQGDTFYGIAKLQAGKQVKEVDARPSDVLALAVRTGSPIYVADEIMQRAAKTPKELEDAYQNAEGMDGIIQEMEAAFRKAMGQSGSE